MRLARITLQDFRNVAWAEIVLTGRQHFFVGRNGQGKTNLLEAVGFGSALRSFRTHESRGLISHEKPSAAVAYDWEQEKLGPSRVVITLKGGTKEVLCDGEKITRLGDYLGKFPTVVFSSQDQQLIRSGPGQRRRWLDLLLASTEPVYLDSLQRYQRALDRRNELLKNSASVAQLEAFEQPMALAAEVICQFRIDALARLAEGVTEAYGKISGEAETMAMLYDPASASRSASDWREAWARHRPRDQSARTTTQGPHRDDVELRVNGVAARDFASEGQQRTLAISLRLAEVARLRERLGVEPVLLADDILGELDGMRRTRFWESLGANRQVIATGTTLPDADLGDWQLFEVNKGAFTTHKR